MILISDMRQFNISGNNETSKFDLYWRASIIVMETDSAHGVHESIHASSGYDATNRVSHAHFISINHLIKGTIQLIKNNVLKKGVDFKFP